MYKYFLESLLSIFWGIYLEVKLLFQMVILFLFKKLYLFNFGSAGSSLLCGLSLVAVSRADLVVVLGLLVQ